VKLATTPLSSPVKAMKRPAPDDEDVTEQQPAKRLKTGMNENGSEPSSSPRKKLRLEEDGIIILDDLEEGEDDGEIIIID